MAETPTGARGVTPCLRMCGAGAAFRILRSDKYLCTSVLLVGRAVLLDVVFHGWFDFAEGVRFGLSQCADVGPAIMRNAITGNDHSGAVFSLAAVDEDRPLGVIEQNGKRTIDIVLGGSLPAVKRDVDVTHSQRLD